MLAEKLFLTSIDGHKIFVRKWSNPEQSHPRGIIHINHGMAEHCRRYEPVAERLVAAGYVVYAHDHRGHGHSIPQGGLVGHYADKNGWKRVIADVLTVNEYIHTQEPEQPIVLLGHSMGSFIVQCYCIDHGDTVDGVVLSGSGFSTPRCLTKKFGDTRTEADWLTRDSDEVDKYISDPLCGFLCTNQMWQDFLGGLETLSKIRNLQSIPNSLPFYLISGERDPLSFHSTNHGINKLANQLRSSGQRDVSVKLYEDGRHEIFNELNRHEVIDDLLTWMDSRMPQPQISRVAATARA